MAAVSQIRLRGLEALQRLDLGPPIGKSIDIEASARVRRQGYVEHDGRQIEIGKFRHLHQVARWQVRRIALGQVVATNEKRHRDAMVIAIAVRLHP